MLRSTTLSITLLVATAAHADTVAEDAVLDRVRAGTPHVERALTVVPLEIPSDAPLPDAHVTDVGDPEIEVATRGPERADRIVVRHRGDTPYVVVPGHVAENGRLSFAVTSYAVTSGGHDVELDLANLSFDAEGDAPRIAFRTLPPTLRWMALTQPNSGELRESLAAWTRRWNTADDEESLRDLARAKRMEQRVDGYVTPLRDLAPSAPDRAVVGYVALLDEDVALVELFGRPDDFAEHWPSAVRALAIEAVLSERNEGWLEATLHADPTPGFGDDAVKSLLERILGEEFDPHRLRDGLIARTAGDSNAATNLLTTEDGRLVHLVHAPDASRRTAPVFDDLEPADDRTEERATGDLERMTERREQAAERRRQQAERDQR